MLTIGGERPPRGPDDESPEEEPAPGVPPPADDEPEPEEQSRVDPVAELREKFAAEVGRREAIERELEFLRRGGGQPTEPPVDPVRQAMDQIRVDPDTWNQMIADPNVGSAVATDALQKIFVLNQHLLRNHLMGEVNQQVEQRLNQVNIRQDGEQLKRSFWEANQGLLPYDRVVRQFAAEVSNEIGQGARYTGEQVLSEIRDRTRAQLKEWNIAVPDEAPRRRARVTGIDGARERFRPAQAEMGSSLGRSRPQMTKVQRDIYRLARRQA